MKIILLTIVLVCSIALFSSIAAEPAYALGLNQFKQSTSSINASHTTPSAKTSSLSNSVQQYNITLLKQDNVINFSKSNITVAISPSFGSAQTVKFRTPNLEWKLQGVLVMATDGWNASSQQMLIPLPFAIEIRDANLKLIDHFSDTQLPYFTSASGIKMAFIEVPPTILSGDFFVCFYGYRSIGLATELENASGNSYLYDKQTGQLVPGVVVTNNSHDIPVNWIIRAVGQ